MQIERRKMRVEIPSVAMGDIAFNLLVFFVILARAQDDSHLQWQPAKAANVQAVKHPKATVLIDVNQKVYLNGRPIGTGQLVSALGELLGDAPVGKRIVQAKVHHEVTATVFEPVFEAISEAGGDLVHILDEDKQKQ